MQQRLAAHACLKTIKKTDNVGWKPAICTTDWRLLPIPRCQNHWGSSSHASRKTWNNQPDNDKEMVHVWDVENRFPCPGSLTGSGLQYLHCWWLRLNKWKISWWKAWNLDFFADSQVFLLSSCKTKMPCMGALNGAIPESETKQYWRWNLNKNCRKNPCALPISQVILAPALCRSHHQSLWMSTTSQWPRGTDPTNPPFRRTLILTILTDYAHTQYTYTEQIVKQLRARNCHNVSVSTAGSFTFNPHLFASTET